MSGLISSEALFHLELKEGFTDEDLEEMGRAFRVFDTNNDGEIDSTERFQRYLRP